MQWAKDVRNKDVVKNVFLCLRFGERNQGLCETRDEKGDHQISMKSGVDNDQAILKQETEVCERVGCEDRIQL